MLGAVKKEVYFMAIIDILTHYDAKKKAAHAAKTVKHGVSARLHHRSMATHKRSRRHQNIDGSVLKEEEKKLPLLKWQPTCKPTQ